MKLLLTSVGIIPETTDDFLKLLGKNPRDCRLVFIPTAGDPEKDKWYINNDKERLFEIGFRDIREVDLKNQTENSLAEILKNTDIVFVAGGNTFYLLDYVNKSGFAAAIKPFLKRGGTYVGVSAGSIIAGPNIETAGWKYADRNIINLQNLTAMELVPFAITPHHCSEVAKAVEESALKKSYPTIALADNQAVLINNGKAKIIGSGNKIIFNNSIGL